MKIAGYDGCEISPWGYMPHDDHDVLKNAIDARGLKLVAGTVGGNFLVEESVVQMMATIDEIAPLLLKFPEVKYLVLLPPMFTDEETGEETGEPIMSPNLVGDEWKTYAANVQRVAGYKGDYK